MEVGGGRKAINAYHDDGLTMTYMITADAAEGWIGEYQYERRHLAGGCFAISRQEADGATVFHIDDFDTHGSLILHGARSSVLSVGRIAEAHYSLSSIMMCAIFNGSNYAGCL